LETTIFDINIDYKETNRPDEFRINCPFCAQIGDPDYKFRCYINSTKGCWNCFNCGSSGGLAKLRRFINLGPESAPITEIPELRNRLNSMFKQKKIAEFNLDTISWPVDHEISPKSFQYMTEVRGFTTEEIERYCIRAGRTYKDTNGELVRRYSGRVLFPFFENKKVVFVVGRSYNGTEPKYLNSVGSKDHVVYGIDNVEGEAIFCEGIISSIAAERVSGIPAISCLGKSLSQSQVAKIQRCCKKVYVCLDGTIDVTQRVRSKINRIFIKAGIEVHEIILPEGYDPDDLGLRFADYLKQARRVHL